MTSRVLELALALQRDLAGYSEEHEAMLEELVRLLQAGEAVEACVDEIWDVAGTTSVSLERTALVENEYRSCGYSLPECMERLAD